MKVHMTAISSKSFNLMLTGLVLISILVAVVPVFAHDLSGKAKYLGNEGVLVNSGNLSVLFDPFFHNNYGSYDLVPTSIRKNIFEQNAPYDSVDAVFISHAHQDHFDAKDVLRYLSINKTSKLYAPSQAIKQLLSLEGYQEVSNRIEVIELNEEYEKTNYSLGNISIEAIRIPHAGWPRPKPVENIVYRISSENSITFMHLGDADSKKRHYQQTSTFWNAKPSNTAFIPFWLGDTKQNLDDIKRLINADKVIGIHVPKPVPSSLIQSPMTYFEDPGQELVIEKKGN